MEAQEDFSPPMTNISGNRQNHKGDISNEKLMFVILALVLALTPMVSAAEQYDIGVLAPAVTHGIWVSKEPITL